MRGGLTNPSWRERFPSVGIVLPVDLVVTLAVDELLVNYILDGKDVVLAGIMAQLWSPWSSRWCSTLGLGLATSAHTCCSCPRRALACLSATAVVFTVTGAAVGGAGAGCLLLGAAHRRLLKSVAAHARDLGPSRCAAGSVEGKQLREWM